MHLHLDPVGGVAGDMFAAALLDIWPELEAGLINMLAETGLDHLVTVQRLDHNDQVLTGSRFHVQARHEDPSDDHHHGHNHHHEHEHDHAHGHHSHRGFRDIRKLLQNAHLADGVLRRALDIFQLLAVAEAKVHGIDPEEVEFHEVGAWDSIADIVTAAWLIETIGISSCSCSSLPMGRGRVNTAHGLLPVPAPATALLLEGFPLFQDDYQGERITPTGAAILRHLQPDFEPLPGSMRLMHSGIGFGSKTFAGMSNILRALLFETESAARRFEQDSLIRSDQVALCQFEIDDQSPEDLALALDRLRTQQGVLDITQTAAFGKKNRLMMHIQMLVKPALLETVIRQCLSETSTLGIRWQIVQRALLERRIESRTVDGHELRIKHTQRPDNQVTVKVESDDLKTTEGGFYGRETLRQQAAADCLENPFLFEDNNDR